MVSLDNYQFDTKEVIPVKTYRKEVIPLLRKILEAKIGPVTNSEFKALMIETTNDIRANNLVLTKQKTYMPYILWVAESTLNVIRRLHAA